MLVPGKHLPPILMFASRDGAKPLSCAPLFGSLLALTAIVRLGCKGLPGTNMIALRPRVTKIEVVHY